MSDVTPGVYTGRDGRIYVVMRDGTVYQDLRRKVWQNGVKVEVQGTLKRVGIARLKPGEANATLVHQGRVGKDQETKDCTLEAAVEGHRELSAQAHGR